MPISAAAEPLPSEAKRALRPSRSPIARGPTRPRLIAAMAGPSTQLAVACRVAAATTTGKIGHSGVTERADADGRDRKARDQPFGAGGIDDGAAGHLPDQADDAADRQHETDLDLGPFLRREVNRDEWTEAGLHIRQKEDEPVEAAQALARRRRCASGVTGSGTSETTLSPPPSPSPADRAGRSPSIISSEWDGRAIRTFSPVP